MSLPDEQKGDPIAMLREIEAYLSFRLTAAEPSVPHSDMCNMRRDINECLKRNGINDDS